MTKERSGGSPPPRPTHANDGMTSSILQRGLTSANLSGALRPAPAPAPSASPAPAPAAPAPTPATSKE